MKILGHTSDTGVIVQLDGIELANILGFESTAAMTQAMGKHRLNTEIPISEIYKMLFAFRDYPKTTQNTIAGFTKGYENLLQLIDNVIVKNMPPETVAPEDSTSMARKKLMRNVSEEEPKPEPDIPF